jgi:outer membrane protein insertion porin family
MKLHSERFSLPAFPRRLIAIAVLALCSTQALAVEPFKVKDIRVEGIQRTEAGTVFGFLPIRVGETYTDEKAAAAIKALYATGFFKDVRIEVEGDVLVVSVEERPAIASVEFTGIKEFEKDMINKALKEVGVAVARIYDKSLVDRAEQELKRQYLSRGLYGVQITTTVTPIARNRVNITFTADEGDVTKIRQIKFIGNKAFTDKELQELIVLRSPGWFTWYNKTDQYSKQKLTGDLESLKSFYLDRGYIEMHVESTQVSITPDKKGIYITINIVEGEKYKVSDIKLDGEMFGREGELKSLLQLKAGDIYSGEKLADSVKKISERLGNFGYAFANVNAGPNIDREKKEVALTIMIDPGKRVYVRRINIAGNTTTRDEVVRREFRQFEGSWYDGEQITLSRDRVDRLGYFKEVTIETPEVPDRNDQVDVNMTVVEKPTGEISLGAGFSNAERLILAGSIHQINAFGGGNTLGLDINTSKYNRTIAVSSTNPYFTDDGVSRSYEVFSRSTSPPIGSIGLYNVTTTGANIRFGVPFTEIDSVFFGIGAEHTKVQTYLDPTFLGFSNPAFYQSNVANFFTLNTSPSIYQAYVRDFGDGLVARTKSFPLTAAWQRDSRNSVITPSAGGLQRVNLELAPVGDLKYMRAVYQQQYFKPLYGPFTLAMNGELDYGRGLSSTPYPVFKNFYAGGMGSVRGFEASSLGPRDPNTLDPLGGTKRIIGNTELQFSFPGAGKDRSLLGFAFFDLGNVFGANEKVRLNDLRYSVGVGLSWISPVGPLKISFGKPLNAKTGDRIERFQFQVGTGF